MSPVNIPPPPPPSGTPHPAATSRKTFFSTSLSPGAERLPLIEPSHDVLDPVIISLVSFLLAASWGADSDDIRGLHSKVYFSLLLLLSWRAIIPLSASTRELITDVSNRIDFGTGHE